MSVISLVLFLSGCAKGDDSSHAQKTATNQVVIISSPTPPQPPTGGAGAPPPVRISQVPLPKALFQTTAVTYTYTDTAGSNRSYLYVMGGAYYDPDYQDPINVNTVYSSLVHPDDGTLTRWVVEKNSLPVPLRGHTSVIYNNTIYVIGGIGMGFQKFIYKSTITMDETLSSYPLLGPWTYAGSLPVEETGHASIIFGDTLYVIGGVESGLPPFPDCLPNCVGSQTTVFSDKIYGYSLSSGLSSTPAFTYTMPRKLFTPSAVAAAPVGIPTNQLWVLGGWDGDANTNSNIAYFFNINSGGALTCVIPCTDFLPIGLSKASALFIPDINGLFLIGGVSGSIFDPEVARREVYFSLLSRPLNWSLFYSLPKAVWYFSSTSAGPNIYVLGGLAS